ncbi:MAG: hypothetical protein GXP54_03930 [Deltaproteobacteria bacterium]|nr:hypothetical protein [Deltaproteobacteria bacterium]
MTATVSTNDDARQAGRGFLFITGAKIWFLLTATFASLAFPRLFGDPVLFGRYRVVSGLLNVVTMVVITATVQAVSKLVSESGASVRSVRRSALTIQTLLFGPVFIVMFVLADRIAGFLLLDPGLGTPLRVASVVVIAYAYYAVPVGALNGTRQFGRQAALDVSFSTMKTGLMVGLVVATGSVTWAFGGFAAAALAVLGLSLFVARVGPDDPPGLPVRVRYLAYLLPLGGYALVLNLLLQADIIGLKASLGGGLDSLWPDASTADMASMAAGIYGAVKNVATIPYQAVISLTFVVFPFVSRATSASDGAAADSAVSGAMRLAAVLSGMATAMLGATGGGLVTLLFGAPYAGGSQVLVPLLAAVSIMSLMFVGNAILASAGRPLVSLFSGGVAAAVQVGLLFAWLPGKVDGPGAWSVAASATAAGCASGAVICLAYLKMTFPKAAWVRTTTLAATGAVIALGLDRLVLSDVAWPVRSLAAGAVFAGVLLVTRGVGPADLHAVRGMLFRAK